MKIVITFLLLISPSLVFAGYPSALPNNDLRKELEGDSDRLIPKSEHFVFGADGQAYHRFLGSKDFYHGTGYWLQFRTEASPNEYFTANLRSIFYSGNSSAGYAAPIGFYNLLGLTGRWPSKILGGDLTGRVLDIERQTVGRGLLVQDREFFGGIFLWERNGHSIFLRGTGTGAIIHDDDTYNLEVSFFNELIGLGALHFGEKDRDGYQFIYSSYNFSDAFSYDLEAGQRLKKWAGLVALNYTIDEGPFQINSRLEGRTYEDGFGDQLVGDIDQDYVSYDQYDKSYTNAINVLTADDNVSVYALKLDLKYKFNHTWRIHFNNEVGKFDFKIVEDDDYYFYRFGIEYVPLDSREDSLVIFVSNKVLTESYTQPPNLVSTSNTPMFTEANFLGLEARFRF